MACGKKFACDRGHVPFFFFWRRLMGFSTAKHIRAKKIYREFSTPVSMQKHHLMLPRYSHYEYLISKSAEFSVFHSNMQALNSRWFYEVCRTFDLQKTMFSFFDRVQGTNNFEQEKIQNPINLNLCWFLHNSIKSFFLKGKKKKKEKYFEKVQKLLICNKKVFLLKLEMIPMDGSFDPISWLNFL